MTDEEKETYKDGQRDQQLKQLDKRVTRLEHAFLGILGAIAMAYAKLKDLI